MKTVLIILLVLFLLNGASIRITTKKGKDE